MTKLGLFGGTFNPIHIGHLRTVIEVQENFPLDKIILIPSSLPPHKEPNGIADASLRLEMVRLSVSRSPNYSVSDVELKRSGRSYSIDTIRHFKSTMPDAELYFIIGLDAFLDIGTWKSFRDIFREIPFIVMIRPGYGGKNDIAHYLQSAISPEYQFSDSQKCFINSEYKPVFIIHVSLIDISSTNIRRLIRQKRSIQFLVTENVEDFIKTKGLYINDR